MTKNFSRYFWRLIYEILARRISSAYWFYPFNKLGYVFRQFCVKRFIKSCGTNLHLGSGVTLSFNNTIGHHVIINENCRLQDCQIGDYALIAPEVYTVIRNHRYENPAIPISQQGYFDTNPPVIHRDVWLGVRVILLPGVTIHEGAIVAAGAIVTKDVGSFEIVGGTPAQVIGYRGEPQAISLPTQETPKLWQ